MIVAALSWWNEPPAALERLILSLAPVCDRLLAVDGRWQLMATGRPRLSTQEEVDTIERTAAVAGLELDLRIPASRAGRWTQIEKRDYLMHAAAEHGGWTLVVDGDTYISTARPEDLRARLAETDLDVALINVTNVGGGVRATWPRKRRLLYRAAAGITVETGHNGYRATDGRWLNGDAEHVDLAPALDVSALIALTHVIDSRPRARRGAQGDYYAARADSREEEWAAV